MELYARREAKGEAIPINIDPADVKDDTPSDGEIRDAVRKLRNGRAGGASKMKAEDIKGWLRGLLREEKEEEGEEDAGDN